MCKYIEKSGSGKEVTPTSYTQAHKARQISLIEIKIKQDKYLTLARSEVE
jgi:ABC-type dipeptide/oligopeptide/nickel transport system ATPase component